MVQEGAVHHDKEVMKTEVASRSLSTLEKIRTQGAGWK